MFGFFPTGFWNEGPEDKESQKDSFDIHGNIKINL